MKVVLTLSKVVALRASPKDVLTLSKMSVPTSYGFLICGHKTHGKTYFGQNILPSVIMCGEIDTLLENYTVSGDLSILPKVGNLQFLAFADELKKEFCKIEGITLQTLEENKEMYRSGLFELSKINRKKDTDYYTKLVADSMSLSKIGLCPFKAVIITDFRQPEEYIYLKERFEQTLWITIRIIHPKIACAQIGHAPLIVDSTFKTVSEDPMENKLNNFPVDIELTRK